jgi:hypothetical protein
VAKLTDSTVESLRRKWAQLEAMVGTDKRIALVADDLVKHWEARYAAMEGKAFPMSSFGSYETGFGRLRLCRPCRA